MKVIVGLGNPGNEYENTRHNLGWVFIDQLQDNLEFPEFSSNPKFEASISEGQFSGEKLILAKPETFMNLSGRSVKKIMDFYKLTPEDIVIIHDDIDLAPGKYKVATDSSSAGHNGVQNIIDELGTQAFRRLRIGIGQEAADGNPSCRIGAHDYVLGKISPEEAEKLSAIEKELLEEIKNLF